MEKMKGTQPTEDDTVAGLLREVAAAPSIPLRTADATRLEPGSVVDDRFTIERHIGSGGMGHVYLARDTELDRAVALKIVPLGADARDQARTLREARAMARLSHPNVVAVHDTGRLDDQHLFIAMEYVRGGTARSWLAQRPRSPSEIVALYVQAARGLAVAHAAGMVHRDFKPDNVLVGDDGRVRIADFGLARRDQGDDAPAAVTDEHLLDRLSATVDERLASQTQPSTVGRVAGTPAYMAPEQFAGAPVDGRADQYAFCVALWEALFGERPFDTPWISEDDEPHRPRQHEGRRGGRVPGWLEPVLRRGLSFHRRDRYPSMHALLDAIERPARRRRRLGIAALTVAGAVLTGVTGFALADVRDERACESGSMRVASVWSPERRARLHAAARAEDPTYGEGAATRLEGRLDAWATRWSEAYRAACIEAPRAASDHAAVGVEAARLRCLDAQLGAVETALTFVDEAAEQGGGGLVTRIDAVRLSLPVPADCARAETLERQRRLALADANSPQALELARRLDRLALLDRTGDAEQAIPLARELLAQTEDPALDHLRLRALETLGSVLQTGGEYEEAERVYLDLFFAARAVDDDEFAADAAAKLLWIVGVREGRLEEADLWARHAEAAIANRDADPQVVMRVEGSIGVLREIQGDYETALAYYERSYAHALEGYGQDHPNVGNCLSNLGAAYDALGRLEEAEETYTRGIEQRRGAIQRPDGQIATLLTNRGLVKLKRDDVDGAIADQRAALKITETVASEDAPVLVEPLLNLGLALTRDAQHAEALVHIERAERISRARLGELHPNVGYCALARGEVLLALDRLDEARVAIQLASRVASEHEDYDPDLVRRITEMRDQVADDRADGEGARDVTPHGAR